MPPLTMASTSLAVLAVGATPVFADIEEGHTLQICPASIAQRITPKTKASRVRNLALRLDPERYTHRLS